MKSPTFTHILHKHCFLQLETWCRKEKKIVFLICFNNNKQQLNLFSVCVPLRPSSHFEQLRTLKAFFHVDLMAAIQIMYSWSSRQYLKHCLHLLLQARPMTRYLPIRKEEFDLRSHVESSGHSVDTCYQVILTEKMCKGYLVKMGGKIKSWKKRWFVFDRLKRTFSYYVGKKTPLFKSLQRLQVDFFFFL